MGSRQEAPLERLHAAGSELRRRAPLSEAGRPDRHGILVMWSQSADPDPSQEVAGRGTGRAWLDSWGPGARRSTGFLNGAVGRIFRSRDQSLKR